MIAFSKETLDDEDQHSHSIRIDGPRIIAPTIDSTNPHESSEGENHNADAQRARAEQEFAMLQRALVHCGLISS